MQLLKLLKLLCIFPCLFNLAVSESWETWCPQESTFRNNSDYSRNLKNLLSSFPSMALTSVFNFSSSGEGPDAVYGLYTCLDGFTGEGCRECLIVATQDMETYCPNSKEAVVWMTRCHLHYSDINFFGTFNVSQFDWFSNGVPIQESDRARYSGLVGVLANLTSRAAFNPLANKSAAGRASPSGPYAVVHCTRDLSSQECNTCLETAKTRIMPCCFNATESGVLAQSCFLRYRAEIFYPETLELVPSVSSPPEIATRNSESFAHINTASVFQALLLYSHYIASLDLTCYHSLSVLVLDELAFSYREICFLISISLKLGCVYSNSSVTTEMPQVLSKGVCCLCKWIIFER